MKQIKSLYWVLLLAFLLTSTGGCGGGNDPATVTLDEVTDAYIFSFPLVMMATTMKNATNTVDPTNNKAPINQLHHAQALVGADFKDVVTPNVDTLYSQAFIDLKDGPLVFVKPAANRYCSAQFLDAWTNAVKIAGSGGDGNPKEEQVWLLMRDTDKDTVVPRGMRVCRFPGDLGWIIGRTLCKSEDDVLNVRAIQEQMRLLPLKVYLSGEGWIPPKGTYDPQYNYIPIEHIMRMTPEEFFGEGNALMKVNPPLSSDQPVMDKIRSVGVGPGMTFDPSVLGKDEAERQAAWKKSLKNAKERSEKAGKKFMGAWGAWEYLDKPIAEFGTEYDYRAMVAIRGLGANPVSAAIYAKANKDSAGRELKAGGRYRIHFEKGALPPVKEDGFWSITAYNDQDFLIPNPLNRYAINDRSSVTFNQDGSLDLLLQPEAPQDGNQENWLPTGTGGFHLFMRMYRPDMGKIDGGWKAPTITEVQ